MKAAISGGILEWCNCDRASVACCRLILACRPPILHAHNSARSWIKQQGACTCSGKQGCRAGSGYGSTSFLAGVGTWASEQREKPLQPKEGLTCCRQHLNAAWCPFKCYVCLCKRESCWCAHLAASLLMAPHQWPVPAGPPPHLHRCSAACIAARWNLLLLLLLHRCVLTQAAAAAAAAAGAHYRRRPPGRETKRGHTTSMTSSAGWACKRTGCDIHDALAVHRSMRRTVWHVQVAAQATHV